MDTLDFMLEKRIKLLAIWDPNFITLPEDSTWRTTSFDYKTLCHKRYTQYKEIHRIKIQICNFKNWSLDNKSA